MTRRIERFSPKTATPEFWAEAGEFVREAVTAAGPSHQEGAAGLLAIVTQHVQFCWEHGLDLDRSVIFDPDQIDAFAQHHRGSLSPGTVANYRGVLRQVGEAVLGEEVYPPKPLPLPASPPSAPYSQTEVADLRTWTKALNTSRRRDNASALMAFGLGAGLRAEEINTLTGTDVVLDGSRATVHLSGPNGREVPVLGTWTEEVVARSGLVGERPVFLPDRDRCTGKEISRFIEHLPASVDVPRLSVGRLRITWIVRHLEAGTPLRVLERAAGVDATQLAKYTRFAAEPSEAEAAELLRGGR